MKSASRKSRASPEGRASARPTTRRSSKKSDVQKHVPPKRPFVAVTFAMTVDGKITTKNFSPVDFTSREDKTHLLRQRALGDAVLIGHSTLKKDNVRLGLPDPKMREARVARGQTPYPLRVIVSNEGRIDGDFLHGPNAAARSKSAARKSDAAPERYAVGRSRVDAATTAA